MNQVQQLPARSEVRPEDTWDLSKLFANDAQWETEFSDCEKMIERFAEFRDQLSQSPQRLAECLHFDVQLDRLAERLSSYAFLRLAEDQINPDYQRMTGRLQHLMSRAAEAASFIRPEILAIPDEQIQKFLDDPDLQLFKLSIERLLRYKPHTLSQREEQMLAMQSEMAGTASKSFRQLLDADLRFGVVEDEDGAQVELSNATFIKLLHSTDRAVRKQAFDQYYEQFLGHENTLAALLSGSIQKDVYYARVRGYDSALSSALFDDNVPISVYDNLIASVRQQLPAVHRYYDLRRRLMKLNDIHHYDTYVPILSEIKSNYTWDQAVETIIAALQPLGSEYCETLQAGLAGRWCDRYPNRGKQSGAFSYGVFDADPYIMMNFQPEVLNHVFTLAHEAGHSMHTFFSARHQEYPYYNYTIFVAEVASTFNEQLLAHHLLSTTDDPRMRAYLINSEIDDIRSTIVRQTMFAEFEKISHEMVEAGEPLTVQAAKETYRKLLEDYFGPEFALDEQLALECLRIPHFYRAFYVYKYATGMSAAIALSQKVLNGGPTDLEHYLNFLKGGCSKFPLDLLRDAGVDMEQPQPVETALKHFADRVSELEQLLS
jgi:oligoendopeptidase F